MFRLAAGERILTPQQTGAVDAVIQEQIEELRGMPVSRWWEFEDAQVMRPEIRTLVPKITMTTNTGLAGLGQVVPLIFTGLTSDDLRAKVRGEQGAASNAAAADRFSPASIGGSSSRADELIKQVTGDFLSTVCPEQIVLREVRKRVTPNERPPKVPATV